MYPYFIVIRFHNLFALLCAFTCVALGLMEGYIAEKAILEEALQQKETQEQRLAEELESTRIQLQQLNENHVLLLRQREALTASLGDTEKGERGRGVI